MITRGSNTMSLCVCVYVLRTESSRKLKSSRGVLMRLAVGTSGQQSLVVSEV